MTDIRTNHKEIITEREQSFITSATTTTSSSKDTEPGVHTISANDLEAIRQDYVNLLGPLNAWKARDIEFAIRAGLDASAILDAIEQTATARRPTHYYLQAILDRYIADGIHTARDAEKARERRRLERYASNRERWKAWYTSPEDLPDW